MVSELVILELCVYIEFGTCVRHKIYYPVSGRKSSQKFHIIGIITVKQSSMSTSVVNTILKNVEGIFTDILLVILQIYNLAFKVLLY